jgi:hypothetical protein
MSRRTPNGTNPFGLYDPNGNGFEFFPSAEERDKAAEETIQAYLDDDWWDLEVTNVYAFVVTHRATLVDVLYPAGKIDEETFCDEAGEYWPNPDCRYKCNYDLQPFFVMQP